MKKIEEHFQYKFKNKELLTQALTHKSFCIGENKYKPHNERLEFVGDAVIGLVIADQLMQIFPEDPEGALSKKRASLVNQTTLSEKALSLHLQDTLILGPGEKEQQSHFKPRLLASAYEALLGAFYQEAGFEQVRQYIFKAFITDIKNIKPDLEFEGDYKTRLQEETQKRKLGTPVYDLLSTAGPSHKPVFLVKLMLSGEEKVRASGSSKKSAEQLAAQIYLKELEGEKHE